MTDGDSAGSPAQRAGGSPSDQHPDSSGRNARLAMVAAVVVAVVAILVVIAIVGDDDSDDASSSQTSEESDSGDDGPDGEDGGTQGSGSEGEQAGGVPDTTGPTTTRVPFEPVAGGDESTLCAAVIERLELYRAATTDELPDDTLTTTLEQFEAQIDVEANDQDWGDRIIEQLTNVRREWATARSALAADDPERAQERNEAALGFFDTAIDTECPTP